MEVISNIYNWDFMDEPLSRWFIFIGAFAAMAWAWKGILAFIE